MDGMKSVYLPLQGHAARYEALVKMVWGWGCPKEEGCRLHKSICSAYDFWGVPALVWCKCEGVDEEQQSVSRKSSTCTYQGKDQ